MCSRLDILIGTILLLAPSPAFAHKLIVEHQVRIGQRVRIESWFETGDSAVGATVKVHDSTGSLLAEGVIDDKGLFFFRFQKAEALRVIVNDGMGHRVELRIKAKELSEGMLRDSACSATACLATPFSAAAVSLLDDESQGTEAVTSSGDRGGMDVGKVLIGVAIFVAIAAFTAFRSRKR